MKILECKFFFFLLDFYIYIAGIFHCFNFTLLWRYNKIKFFYNIIITLCMLKKKKCIILVINFHNITVNMNF